jgi:hypothetical protein
MQGMLGRRWDTIRSRRCSNAVSTLVPAIQCIFAYYDIAQLKVEEEESDIK